MTTIITISWYVKNSQQTFQSNFSYRQITMFSSVVKAPDLEYSRTMS